MPSPFPGMNPFLEHADIWQDFHGRFIPAAAEEIGRQVRPAYIVKIDQNVYVHELPEGERRLLGRPDVYLTEEEGSAVADSSPSTATIAPPVRARLLPLTITEREGFIEILDGSNQKLITAIELLSPANKTTGSDRDQYLAKRNLYLDTGVHLVEIDLLRSGRRVRLHPTPQGDYCVIVSRAEDRPNAGVWPIGLRDPLPLVPIPLRGRGEAPLALQSVLNRVYDAAGYADYIYKRPPQPPLSSSDKQWAEALLK
jgi:uncharacterized protein DUF4058